MRNRQPFAEPAVRLLVTYLNANARWCCVRAPCRYARGLPWNAPFHDRGGRYRDEAPLAVMMSSRLMMGCSVMMVFARSMLFLGVVHFFPPKAPRS
jgi:hypothetical protein